MIEQGTQDIIFQLQKQENIMLWLLEKNFLDQPIKNKLKTYGNIKKITTSQGNNYAITYLQNYDYFIKHYKMMAIDLSKQQALDDDLKVI